MKLKILKTISSLEIKSETSIIEKPQNISLGKDTNKLSENS